MEEQERLARQGAHIHPDLSKGINLIELHIQKAEERLSGFERQLEEMRACPSVEHFDLVSRVRQVVPAIVAGGIMGAVVALALRLLGG